MTSAIATVVREDSLRATRKRSIRFVLGGWKFWLTVAAVTLIVGAAFNWSWLVAAGIAPVMLALAPCVAMCALHLCSNKESEGGCKGQR